MIILSPILKKIEQKYGYKPQTEIGRGRNSVVYDVGGNQVMKITNNFDEASAAYKLVGKNLKNVCHYFKVMTTKKKFPKKYYIIQEKLSKLGDSEHYEEFYKYLSEREKYKNYDLSEEIVGKCENKNKISKIIAGFSKAEIAFLSFIYITQYWQDVENDFMKFKSKLEKNRDQIKDIINGLHELAANSINHFDIHEENIMKRKNSYVLIDILDDKEVKIEIIENKIIAEKQTIYARTQKEKNQGLRGVKLEDWSGMMVFLDVSPGDIFVGKDCLFDIRIAFLDSNDKVLSVGTIKKDSGRVIAPKGTAKAVETASKDQYDFIIGQSFPIPAKHIRATNYYSGYTW